MTMTAPFKDFAVKMVSQAQSEIRAAQAELRKCQRFGCSKSSNVGRKLRYSQSNQMNRKTNG